MTADTQTAVTTAISIAREAASQISNGLGSELSMKDKLQTLRAFRRVLIPIKHPGRRRNERITRAHRDWKDGVSGAELYRKHIPGWTNHSQWRRESEARRLMSAIRTRERRESARKLECSTITVPI